MGVVNGVLYATVSDFNALGLPAKATVNQQWDIPSALQAASDELSTYLSSRFTLPLLQWDQSLVWHTCQVAAYILLIVRGLAPTGMDLDLIKNNYRMATRWAERMQASLQPPQGWLDSSSGGVTPQTYVASNLPRNWYPPTRTRG